MIIRELYLLFEICQLKFETNSFVSFDTRLLFRITKQKNDSNFKSNNSNLKTNNSNLKTNVSNYKSNNSNLKSNYSKNPKFKSNNSKLKSNTSKTRKLARICIESETSECAPESRKNRSNSIFRCRPNVNENNLLVFESEQNSFKIELILFNDQIGSLEVKK